MLRIRLTSLLLVEERLLEAKYFARRLARQRDRDRLGYELNAFLAAARSVTFLLQKEMAKVPGFAVWWDGQRYLLAGDAAAAFFLKLRNFSQKEGRISLVGGSLSSGKGRRWSYRFAGNADRVPPALLHRDLADCCHEHVAKLARIVLACTDAFPYQTCPRRALTPAGVKALQLSLGDVEESLGFPRGWTDIGDPVSHDRRVHALREHVDGIDFAALRRLAGWKPKPAPDSVTPSSVLSEELLASLVKQLEGPSRRVATSDLAAPLLLGGTPERGPDDP
jgi:hypothetical protein